MQLEKYHDSDRVENQKHLLKGGLRNGEVIVPLLAEVIGYSQAIYQYRHGILGNGEVKTVGYAISDEDKPIELTDNQTIYVESSENPVPNITWQGLALSRKLMTSATVEPVYAVVHYADPVGPKSILAGWRVTAHP